MTLKDQIFDLCNKLAQNGWREMILSVTNNQLDIKQPTADKLREVLLEPNTIIDRKFSGFEDYRLDGNQGITPLSFSKSLLYHALASPNVTNHNLTYYPSLADLDLVENFIYSNEIKTKAISNSLASLKALHGSKLVVAVFAYQYRTWEESSHRVHADMNYSRTGISRVGTADSIYDSQRRSFWVGDADGEISVLPCRYGAFLAIKDKGSNIKKDFSIMDTTLSDNNLEFIVPLLKLFDGNECLSDVPNLKLDFETYHRNEKLGKVHNSQISNTIPIGANYNLNKFPFIIDDTTQLGFLYSTSNLSGSIIIIPTKGNITEPAIQDNKYVAFQVPKNDPNLANGRGNRFNSSFQIPAINGSRSAPEYVNIRQRVKNMNVVNLQSDIDNINNLPLNDFNNLLNNGEYLAIDFIDKTGDGYVKIKNIDDLPNFAAYSLITALDFFPLINQRDILRWDNSDSIKHFNQGSPSPLSDGRIKANSSHSIFNSDKTTTPTAIISDKQSLQISSSMETSRLSTISYLPDAASNVFQPGWDISLDVKNNIAFYAAYGLGSPFPEDAKLCAALNSFWPAAAPDASRTFFLSLTFDGFGKQPTAIPLTDEELGIHPKNAHTLGVSSKNGWDGEYGPFLESDPDGEFVNYADISRSDYSFNAWKGFMNMDLLKKVTTSQLIARMKALQKSILELLPPQNDAIITNRLWLVSFQEINDWSTQNDRMNAQLNGSGFQFIFITPKSNTPITDTTDIKRLRMKVDKKYECQLDKDTFVWREVTQINTIVLNSNDIPKVNFISNLS